MFEKNVEMLHWITEECDKRGIWLVQMFYSLLVSQPFAEHLGIETQLSEPSSEALDYTRKSIAQFVKEYPNVGLLVCLGEALQGIENQSCFLTDTVLSGVKDGMEAAGLKEQPPVVVRAHATDPDVVMPAAVKVYKNIYTMAKYNGESLTTWQPRGDWQRQHLAMSALTSNHVANIHILANLEPFRYGAQRFIQKCVQASRDRLGATGIHLYPLFYWDWPVSPDITEPRLKQWERDWIWFEAWARYAWNPDIPKVADREYWITQLAEMYGTREAAEKILAAYNDAGECAPRILRRFGITEGNRQTMSLGMTFDQLVNPEKYRPYEDLWKSQSPPGERLDEYANKEWAKEPHEGETPPQIIREVLDFSQQAVDAIKAAEPHVTKNREEFKRLRNDIHCIRAMTENYAEKVQAAMLVLRYRFSHELSDMEQAETHLAKSLEAYLKLAELTKDTYHFANSLQTSHRKIPFPGSRDGNPANYHWTQLVDDYRRELADFRAKIENLRETGGAFDHPDESSLKPAPTAPSELTGLHAATFTSNLGTKPLGDRDDVIGQRGLVDTSDSPYVKVRSVGLKEVRWTRGFWAQRFESCRDHTIPSMWRLMEGTRYTHFVQNFRIAAGLAEGRHRGAPFNDGDFYKWLEAACVMYGVTQDPELQQHINESIDLIGKAQRPDGYIHTQVLIRRRNGDTNAVPFQDRHNFEMYNMGHLITAACVHYRVTGKTNLLAIAEKAADFLYRTFHSASPEAARSSVCPSHYMAMVELYRATHEPRYLELAKKFFELRSQITDGGDDNQDRIPFEQQREAMGHAVRANYLYAGATDLFMETGDESLWVSLEQIWENLVQKKMYITGGCGALYDGASPYGSSDQGDITRTHQAYGHDYQLPNLTAYNETCANIGNVLWNWRMFLATGEARFIDVAELALYNSVLSGVSLDGTKYFYVNPLRTLHPMPHNLRWSRTRVTFVGSFCCPPNVTRTEAEVSNYAYAKSDDAIWVNLYGGSTLETELAGTGKVNLTQETEYPWSSRVRVTINKCGAKPFSLKLRVPGWVKRASVRVNFVQLDREVMPETYLELKRVWKPGDFVDLDLPMQPELIEANPLVEETMNQVAIKRGPVVYCLESTDLPEGVDLTDVAIPSDIELRARYDGRLLGGVVVIEGVAEARPSGDWSNQLYRALQPGPSKPCLLRLIPYFAWDNRGRSEMTVWLPIR